MNTEQIVVDRVEARALFRKYREHQHYSQPIDQEIQRTYQLIAQGRVVIRALESVKNAGVNEEGLPKLAIVRADAKECYLRYGSDGSARFSTEKRVRTNSTQHHFDFPAGSFPAAPGRYGATKRAIAPLIPIHLRPKRGLQNYHILFEAIWYPAPPIDPLLLRRIGKGDLWVVCAAWELTGVEQAALSARINA
jgi:hypothetical protein